MPPIHRTPSEQLLEGPWVPPYSYVRPLATIEPTAIRLGMPVNTQMKHPRRFA